MTRSEGIALMLIVFVCVPAAVSCRGEGERFELREIDQSIVRLDRGTGEIHVLVGEELVRVRSQEEVRAGVETERALKEHLSQPKQWDAVRIEALGSEASLKTKWRDGSMLFTFSIEPVPKDIDNNVQTTRDRAFVLIFHDKDLFQVAEYDLVRSDLVRLRDSGSAEGLIAYGTVPCSSALYEEFADWGVRWSF